MHVRVHPSYPADAGLLRAPLVAPAFLLAFVALTGCSSAADAPGGGGTISGSFAGRAFNAVAASYRIGAPDDPAHNIVIYVFDKAVGCNEISDTGWDTAIANETQAIEMKLIGTTAGDYVVALGPTFSQGQASVNYTLSSTTGTPTEVAATGGSIKLEKLDSAGGGVGTFNLSFASGDALTGTFNAISCAGGHEP